MKQRRVSGIPTEGIARVSYEKAPSDFAVNLRRLIYFHHWSAREAATVIGVSEHAMSAWLTEEAQARPRVGYADRWPVRRRSPAPSQGTSSRSRRNSPIRTGSSTPRRTSGTRTWSRYGQPPAAEERPES